MLRHRFVRIARFASCLSSPFLFLVLPELAIAQSPFDTGANNLVTNFLTLAFPVAVVLVMGLGIAAIAGRISWGWAIGALVGIGIVFAAQPIVTWVRGLFGA
jgi:type IV secretory pathway VirB2 component (pilin)